MRKLYSLLVYLAGAMYLPACGQKSFDEKMESIYKNTVPQITSAQLKELDRKQLFLLDIRSTEEFRVSHIEGARFVDYKNFNEDLFKDIPKNAEVVLYCSVGYRSERIGEKMQRMGYSNVRNLYGGIFDWKNKENEVVNIHNQPTDSIHAYNHNWGRWLYKGVKVYE